MNKKAYNTKSSKCLPIGHIFMNQGNVGNQKKKIPTLSCLSFYPFAHLQ